MRTGRYGFPAYRLPTGYYALRVGAVGYELGGGRPPPMSPAKPRRRWTCTSPKSATSRLSSTSTEWLISTPGTPEQKRPLIECMSCHTLERVVRSHFTGEQFVGVLKRMANYANNSTQGEGPGPRCRARRAG